MDPNHVITIDQQHVETMKNKMQTPPKLLQDFGGKESCCIFKVPQSLLETNMGAYQPQIVSIGPYHHGNIKLEMIQEHKWRYLKSFLTRTDKSLEYFLDRIIRMEKEIRESYSESIEYICSNVLAEMMVLDGVFLIELFRKVEGLIKMDQDNDPIFNMVWVSPILMRDLLSIENQIPFVVLQKLFTETQPETETETGKLPSLILNFFNYALERPDKVLNKCVNLEGKHLLDFFRKSFVKEMDASTGNEKRSLEGKHFLDCFSKRLHKEIVSASNNSSFELIQPATKLVVAGVKFKKNKDAESFLDIQFQNGVLWIPRINMDDFYTCFILNGMIFEQFYSKCSKNITDYVVLMGCLINTSTDVGLLSEHKIIQNYFGTNKELVKFFNNAAKDVSFNIKENTLTGVFKDINEYCNNGWHVGWAGFKHKYFESPWAFLSALAALVLLLLAALQTIYTVYPFYYEHK